MSENQNNDQQQNTQPPQPTHQPQQAPPPPPPSYHQQAPYQQHQPNYNQAGRGKAIASLVLGIISIVFCYLPLVGLVCGIVGLIMASQARREGFNGGMRQGGVVTSIIGIVISSIWTFSWLALGSLFTFGMRWFWF
ncbi:MAG: DUF4190 domain-containing protein [Defluviitaleaceae bacterium]|nr:DUF4190 domain-containing protein [Defluviitaleaceae bacterium]